MNAPEATRLATYADDTPFEFIEPDAADYLAFKRMLAGFKAGAEVTSDIMADDIRLAAQVHHNAIGPLPQKAAHDGLLLDSGRVTRSRRPSARGRKITIWIRTEVSA